MIQQDEKNRKAKQDDDEAQEDPKQALEVDAENGEALAEGQAVGKAEAGSKEQSPRKQSTKTHKRPNMKTHEDDEKEMSPIIEKMVDEEVEKRLKARQSETRRLFQDEADEEDARRQYEESVKNETGIRKNKETQSR
jgi:hypothetical protein